MDYTTTQPKFISLHDLGLSLTDSRRPKLTRQTLIRRGRDFATVAGLQVFKVRGGEFVSAAAVARLHDEAAA